ncbi:MAG: TolC family outer membrane protein [Rhodocyclaceae bacterium]|nr:TolC family outer membrane protein [Rhodocyclaceae bacterium]
MTSRLKPLTVLLATALAANFSAHSAHAADLLSVYRDAVAYDAQFAAARASLEAGREKAPQGLAGLLPVVVAGASTTKNDIDTQLRTPGATTTRREYNTNGWSVKLTQPLIDYSSWVTYSQAKLSVAVSEAQYEQARMDLMVRAAQAYFDVLLAQDAVATAQSLKTVTAEQLESAKRNFEVGTSTITDSHEAQSRYDLIVAQELAAINDLTVKRHTLESLIGKPAPSLRTLRSGVQIMAPEPLDMGKWVEQADTGSPSIQVAQAGLAIASREISKQRAGHYPTLNLVATSSHSAQNKYALSVAPFSGIDTDSRTVGLELSLPLFTGGYQVSKQREAVSLKDKAQADLDYAQRSVQLGVRQAYLGVTSGLAQVKAYEAALTSSQSSLDSNKLGYEVGVRINIDVLNAQSQLYDTRYKLSKARFDTLLASLKLKAATGNLNEKDLDGINALLGE